MPAILFLTYYYPPCNATGANRPGSFAKNLADHGFNVTVVTRQWTGNEKTWKDQISSNQHPLQIEKNGEIEIHFLPYKSYQHLPIGLLNTIAENLRGYFNYELQFGQYRNYIENLIKAKQFDYLMTSVPPLTVLKTASYLAGKNNIPMIVDFRDFENDIVLYKKRKHSWIREKQHKLLMGYFKKWMEPATIIFTASPPITDYIGSAINREIFTLNNGFNKELLDINEKQSENYFEITVTGSLFEMANLPVMIDTCKLIYERNPGINIKFNFIGLLINENVAQMFQKAIPEANLKLTHRIPQVEAFKIASASHVLMLAGFDEMRGAYTTKIFEYLGLRRNIIQIPGDKDVVEELIRKTNTGKTPHTSEKAYTTIMEWYNEWRNTGKLNFPGDMNEIMNWSREKQFEKLIQRLEHAEV